MAEEVKYNSTLVSGRADETLSYSRYIKDEETGESVKESLEKKANVLDVKNILDKAEDTTSKANAAIENAKTATTKADKAAKDAQNAALDATKAKEAADTATADANKASLSVSTVKEAAEKAAKLAYTATSESLKATAQSKNATAKAEEATARANEVSHNPPKLGDDGYWYVFNEHKREYVKTEHYSKGGVDYPTFFIDDSDSCLYVSANNDSDKERFSLEDGNLCLTVN